MNRPAPPLTLDAVRGGSAAGEVSYVELTSHEHRLVPRHRTRLRPGKIVDTAGRFLIECLIHDQSAAGARLRLGRQVVVPRIFGLFDDRDETIAAARIMWREDHNLGVRFMSPPEPVGSSRLRTLGQAFYAVRG